MHLAEDIILDVPGESEMVHREISHNRVSLLGDDQFKPVFRVCDGQPQTSSRVQLVDSVVCLGLEMNFLWLAIF